MHRKRNLLQTIYTANGICTRQYTPQTQFIADNICTLQTLFIADNITTNVIHCKQYTPGTQFIADNMTAIFCRQYTPRKQFIADDIHRECNLLQIINNANTIYCRQ